MHHRKYPDSHGHITNTRSTPVHTKNLKTARKKPLTVKMATAPVLVVDPSGGKRLAVLPLHGKGNQFNKLCHYI